MEQNYRLKWYLKWPLVITVTILCWPVGIFLIYKRISADNKSGRSSVNIMIIAGIILLFLGVVAEIVGPDDKSMAVTGRIEYFFIFICSGLALTIAGFISKKNALKYKRYINIIINHNITHIDKISSQVSQSYERTLKDLNKMIEKGYLKGAYINEGTHQVILPIYEGLKTQDRIVSCKNCGANNTVYENAAKCEYCGSPLTMNV